MTTGTAIVQRIERELLAGLRDPVNKLSSALTDTTGTAVALTYDASAITAGDVIECEAETMNVWAVSGQDLTVERGWNGSTAATHAQNAIVRVNPRFPWQDIFAAVNDELLALSADGLYQIDHVDLTTSTIQDTYDMTGVTVCDRLLEVTYDTSGNDNRWPDLFRFTRLVRNASTSEFASGFQLKLDCVVEPGRTMRVVYAKPFTTLSALSDDLESTAGLASSMEDAVMWGAMARLLLGKDGKRTFLEAQGDSRRQNEVVPLSAARSASAYQTLRDSRVRKEKLRLQQRYPYRLVKV